MIKLQYLHKIVVLLLIVIVAILSIVHFTSDKKKKDTVIVTQQETKDVTTLSNKLGVSRQEALQIQKEMPRAHYVEHYQAPSIEKVVEYEQEHKAAHKANKILVVNKEDPEYIKDKNISPYINRVKENETAKGASVDVYRITTEPKLEVLAGVTQIDGKGVMTTVGLKSHNIEGLYHMKDGHRAGWSVLWTVKKF